MSEAEPSIQVKGSVLRSRLALIEDLAPGTGTERVLGRLPEADRNALATLLPSSWYPFDLGSRLDEAVVAELGGGRTEFFEKLGEASAEKNLGPGCVHRRFLVPGDPHAFLEKTPLIYSFYYDRGRRDYQRTGPSEGRITTHDAETFSVPDCLTVVGWHRRALQMCGAENVVVVEEECRARGGSVCRYTLRWK